MDSIDFTYLYQWPQKYTFQATKVKQWVEKWCRGHTLNLFAGKTLLDLDVDEIRIDLDHECPADFHMDAKDYVDLCIKDNHRFHTIILDPPWSLRQSRECYDGRWIGNLTEIKNKILTICYPDTRIITFGRDTVGMSKKRGFKKIAICLTCHGGANCDSIGLVEEKI